MGPEPSTAFVEHSWALGSSCPRLSLALTPLSPRAFFCLSHSWPNYESPCRGCRVDLELVLGRPGLINGVPGNPG